MGISLSSPHRVTGGARADANCCQARGPDGQTRSRVGSPVSVIRPPNHHTLLLRFSLPPNYKLRGYIKTPQPLSSPSRLFSHRLHSLGAHTSRRQERRRSARAAGDNDDDGAASAATAAGTAAAGRGGVRGHHAHQGVRGRAGVGDPQGHPPRALRALRRHPRGRHHLRQAHRPLQGLRLRDVQGGGRGQEGLRGRHPRHQRPPRQLQPRLPRRQAAVPAAAHPPPRALAAGHPGAARARSPLPTPAHASHRGGIQGRVAGAMVLPSLHDAPSAAAAGRALRPRRAPAVPRRAPILPRRHHLRVLPELRRGPELQCEGRPSGSCRHGRVLPTGALRVPGGSAGRHGGGAQRHDAGVPVLPLPVPRLAGSGRPRRALLPPGLRRRRHQRPGHRLQAHRHGRRSQSGAGDGLQLKARDDDDDDGDDERRNERRRPKALCSGLTSCI